MTILAQRGVIYLDYDGRWRLALEDADGGLILSVDLPATVTEPAAAIRAGEADLAAFGYRAGQLIEVEGESPLWEFELLPAS